MQPAPRPTAEATASQVVSTDFEVRGALKLEVADVSAWKKNGVALKAAFADALSSVSGMSAKSIRVDQTSRRLREARASSVKYRRLAQQVDVFFTIFASSRKEADRVAESFMGISESVMKLEIEASLVKHRAGIHSIQVITIKASSSGQTPAASNSLSDDEGTSAGVLVGVIVGVLCVLCMFILLVPVILARWRNAKVQDEVAVAVATAAAREEVPATPGNSGVDYYNRTSENFSSRALKSPSRPSGASTPSTVTPTPSEKSSLGSADSRSGAGSVLTRQSSAKFSPSPVPPLALTNQEPTRPALSNLVSQREKVPQDVEMLPDGQGNAKRLSSSQEEWSNAKLVSSSHYPKRDVNGGRSSSRQQPQADMNGGMRSYQQQPQPSTNGARSYQQQRQPESKEVALSKNMQRSSQIRSQSQPSSRNSQAQSGVQRSPGSTRQTSQSPSASRASRQQLR